MGGGAEVKLRLRRPNNEWDFFPYNQILDTMLHELCHNEHGPHNADFYNLLDELRKVIVPFLLYLGRILCCCLLLSAYSAGLLILLEYVCSFGLTSSFLGM